MGISAAPQRAQADGVCAPRGKRMRRRGERASLCAKKELNAQTAGHRQKSGAHERGGKQPGMQQGVRLKQRQHGEKLQPCDSGEKQQKETKHGGKQHEPLQPGQLG